MLCRAAQDRWDMAESSDKTWSTGEGNGKPLQYSCLENPMLLLSRFSRVRLCGTPWTAAYQAPPSMGLSRQEYWRGLPLLSLENPINSMKRHKGMTLKDEFSRLVGAQYAVGEEQRYSSRRNEEVEPKWKQHPVVDVTGDRSKVRCYKEQYCIGT